MTVIEAIKSGKRFKHSNDILWIATGEYSQFIITPQRILSDDWMVESGIESAIESEIFTNTKELTKLLKYSFVHLVASSVLDNKIAEIVKKLTED